MSQITRALRRRGGAEGALSTEPDASSLEHYDREERVTGGRQAAAADDAPALQPTRRMPAREPSAPAARTRGGAVSGVDAEARLVTGTSNPVSIEQYRRLAATLHQAQVDSQLKIVMITSALPGEGKTLTAVNLALTLSEAYARRVLVIDADLRGPSVHDVLGVPNTPGLGEALRGEGKLSFVHVSNSLAFLPAGAPGPTPLAGLTSGRMTEILEDCAAHFEWVVIDTPPISVLPDAQVLARLAGAVLFVVGAASTPAAAVERAIAELGGPEAIFGVVLNRIEERRIPSASYYGHYQRRSQSNQ